MVAHVLRLRLALLVGALRGERRAVIKTVLATLVFVAAVAAVIYGVLLLQDESVDVTYALTVTAGAALVVGVLFGPMLGGVDDQLSPRKFAVFGLSPQPLAWTLLLGALISLPSLAIMAACAAFAMVWMAHDVPTPIAVTAAIVAALTCIVGSRVSMLVASLWRLHRSREATGLLVLAAIIIIVPIGIFVGSLQWDGVVPTPFVAAVEILALTPLGAVWAWPGQVALGSDAAVTTAVVAVATLALLVWAWIALVGRALSTIEKPTAARERTGMGWFALLPSTQVGGVAARSLVYWLRDRRYIVNLAIVPFGAVAAALPLLIAGVPQGIVFVLPVLIMALFFGWIPHNDIAYDSTAVWMHIVSGVRGVADRIGRLVPIILIAVPILAISIPIATTLYGRWAILPALVGTAANLFLAGLGLSSISSVLAPYAVTRPGDSPFQQPQRTGSGFGAQAAVLIGAIVCSLPSILITWKVLMGDVSESDNAMWVGLGCGFGVLIVGIIIGSLIFDRRGAKIMEFAEAN